MIKKKVSENKNLSESKNLSKSSGNILIFKKELQVNVI